MFLRWQNALVQSIQVSSLPGHTENDPAGSTCAWNLVRRWPRRIFHTQIPRELKDFTQRLREKSALKITKNASFLDVLTDDLVVMLFLSLKSSNIEHVFFLMTIWDGPYFHYRGRYGHLKDHDFAYILWTHSFRQWNLAVYPQFGKRVDRCRGTSLSFQYFDWQELGTCFIVWQSSSPIYKVTSKNVTLQKGCDHSINPLLSVVQIPAL